VHFFFCLLHSSLSRLATSFIEMIISADTTREFDLKSESWVDAEVGGFALPRAAKTDIAYRSRDEVLVAASA
jgi:hypothetical protein